MKIQYLILSCLFIFSCSSKPVLKQIKNEVWSVKAENGEFLKNRITLLETYEYDDKGLEIGHILYSTDGSLAGKELAVFDDKYELPVGTKYFSAKDSLLSYYSLKYDDKGQKISRWGFNAKNDELLRMENFFYDDKGNMIKKEIRDADSNLQRIYEFDFDIYGNETKMVVKDSDQNVRFYEDYKISKYDDNKKWLENWGWRDDKPVNYRKRELVYSE